MRLFVAVAPEAGLVSRVLAAQRRLGARCGACAGVRWTGRDGLHFTLKFLGETEEGAVEKVSAALGAVSRDCGPFRLGLEGAGVFPAAGDPRVVWIGTGRAESLSALARSVGKALEPLGFPAESREFVPHLTIGRVSAGRDARGLREAVRGESGVPVGEMEVSRIALVRSVLAPGGAKHSEIEGFELCGSE